MSRDVGPTIRVADRVDAVVGEAAAFIARRLRAAVDAHGRARMALAGGSTPRRLYDRLAAVHRDDVPWSRVCLVTGDERPVPFDDPDSNWGMAWDALLSRVPLGPRGSLRFRSEGEPTAAVVTHFERNVRAEFGIADGALPRFDLVLLGLGDDGHTASLFPGSPALDAGDALAAANPVAALGQTRYTLTVAAINAAACVVFFVAGATKAAAVAAVLEGPRRPRQLPAQAIAPADGELVWFLDRDAAARLERT